MNILGNTLAAAFPLEAMMSGPDLERPTPGRGNVFSGKGDDDARVVKSKFIA